MAFQQYVDKFKSFLTSWSASAAGNGTTETFDHEINTSQELNNLRNTKNVNDMVQLSNAYYDQVSIGRAIDELYKKPKDYLQDFIVNNELVMKRLENLSNEVQTSVENISKQKDFKTISKKLQLKLSLIKSKYDA